MNQIIPFPKVIGTAKLAPINADPIRTELVNEMANHLLAGMTFGLDLTSDFDVIRYLKNTPEQYRARVITAHIDDAIYAARQAIIATIMGRNL